MLNATLPQGWSFDFNPFKVDVDADGRNTSTLIVTVADDASPGSTYPFAVHAFSNGSLNGEPISNKLALNVTVAAPPPPTPNPPPFLTLAIAADSTPAGSSAVSTLTLYQRDLDNMRVDLSIAGDAAWLPRLPDGDFFVVYRDVPLDITAAVTPPASTAAGTTRAFTITAKVDALTYLATWNVTTLAPIEATSPTSAPTQPTAPTGTTAGTGAAPAPQPDPAASGAPPVPQYALDAVALQTTMDVTPGGLAAGKFQIRNTGTEPLHLALRGDAADGWPVVVSPSQTTLAPGALLDITLTVEAPADTPPGGTGAGTITITGDNGLLRTVPFQLAIVKAAQTAPPDTDSQSQTQVPQSAPVNVSAGAVAAATGLVVVGGAALAIARRPWREKLIWGAVGLYTRLARPDVLGHEEREKLYRTIETQPGIHFHAVQRDLNWNTGTLTYHLRVLERHGFVVSRRDGPYRRFYIQGAAPKKETFTTDGPHGLRADVLEAIRNHHGISQTDLALALGANKQTVNYHVKALERGGIIRVEKRGRETFLYAQAAGSATGDAAGVARP